MGSLTRFTTSAPGRRRRSLPALLKQRPGLPIRPVFQPIVDLRNGCVSGFEALARLMQNGASAPHADFLAGLPRADRLWLFETMLDQSLAAMKGFAGPEPGLSISVNVERFLFLEEAFLTSLTQILDAHAYQGSGLVLEFLEEGIIEDEARMIEAIARVRRLGVRVALDDLGRAHSSLIDIKTLPVDILKLDQSFVRGLAKAPHDLQFVLSLLSLARGLGKALVIEGVETAEILDALMILGVEFAQGYGIARPMPADQVRPWLDSYKVPVATRSPRSLLGSFASHLMVVETCRILMHQPLPVARKEKSKNPDNCEIGRYFNRCGLHDTAFGAAHKQFHRVMTCYGSDYPSWKAGADGFADTLAAAIAQTPTA
ncbi:EAL domain-containing protein [uncultured Methylobacterium sp.]|uniref:EAL domain-containing protein n=1 Tax=uncultured Methylobacterium sp. TaxID=157278 RepID=UPI0035CA7B0D